MPSLILSRDFNFAFMESWGPDDKSFLSDTITSCQLHSLSISSIRAQASLLLSLVEEHMFTQYVKEATIGNNILDLVFCNDSDLISSVFLINNEIISDHRMIIIDLNITLAPQSPPPRSNFSASSLPEYDLEKVTEDDWVKINDILLVHPWDVVSSSSSSDEMLMEIIHTMEAAVSTVLRKPSTQSLLTSSGLTFKSNNKIPRSVHVLLRRKLEASKKLLKANSLQHCVTLRTKILAAEEELKISHRSQKLAQESKAWSKMKTNPKAFFSYINQFKKTSNTIVPFVDSDNVPLKDNAVVSLNDHFCTVFSIPDQSQKINDPAAFFHLHAASPPPDSDLLSLVLTDTEIVNAIAEQSLSSASGPDGVLPIILRKCSAALIKPL